MSAQPRMPQQQPAPAAPADQVAEVVAHDRGERGERDDGDDVQLPAARQDRGGDQRGLAGQRDAHRLAGDEQRHDRQPDPGDVDDRGQHASYHRSP